jgi:hypothetical protein
MVDTIEALIGDDELIKNLTDKRLVEKKEFALKKLTPMIDEVIAFVANQEKKLESEVQTAIADWDADAQKKKTLKATLTRIKDIAGALGSSGADTTVLEDETSKALNDPLLVVGERPSSPEKVEMALVMARSIRNEITQMLDKKKNELA